jgi:hypothetical protein
MQVGGCSFIIIADIITLVLILSPSLQCEWAGFRRRLLPPLLLHQGGASFAFDDNDGSTLTLPRSDASGRGLVHL